MESYVYGNPVEPCLKSTDSSLPEQSGFLFYWLITHLFTHHWSLPGSIVVLMVVSRNLSSFVRASQGDPSKMFGCSYYSIMCAVLPFCLCMSVCTDGGAVLAEQSKSTSSVDQMWVSCCCCCSCSTHRSQSCVVLPQEFEVATYSVSVLSPKLCLINYNHCWSQRFET